MRQRARKEVSEQDITNTNRINKTLSRLSTFLPQSRQDNNSHDSTLLQQTTSFAFIIWVEKNVISKEALINCLLIHLLLLFSSFLLHAGFSGSRLCEHAATGMAYFPLQGSIKFHHILSPSGLCLCWISLISSWLCAVSVMSHEILMISHALDIMRLQLNIRGKESIKESMVGM